MDKAHTILLMTGDAELHDAVDAAVGSDPHYRLIVCGSEKEAARHLGVVDAHLFICDAALLKDDVKNALMSAALLESVRRKSADHLDVFARFFETNGAAVVAAAETVAATYRRGGRLMTMGNGGSSCDAAHVAVEFQHPVTAGRPALTAINLASDMAMLTAVGNDVGMEHVYVRQVIAHGRAGDCLIGLSTSGNSANLIRAFRKAKEMGIATLGLAGMTGGEMANLGLDHCLVVGTDSIHRIQEVHVAVFHILWDLVHTLLGDERGGLMVTEKEAAQ